MGIFEIENLKLKRKLARLARKSEREVDRAIEDFWSKWAIRIGGGFMVFGMIIGRFTR